MDDKPISVLLAEDNRDQALLIRTKLDQDGSFVVDVAEDGITCLDKLAQDHYDLLLLNYNLPKANGLEVLERVKKQGHNMPVVMLTGQGSEVIAAQAMREGAYDYVIKSEEYLTALPAVMRKALEKQRLLMQYEEMGQEIGRRNRELTIVNAIGETLSQPLDLQQILGQALSKTLELMEVDGGIIHLWDEQAGELVCAVVDSLPKEVVRGMARIKPGEGLPGRVMESGQTIVIENLAEMPEAAMAVVSRAGVKSLVSTPLQAKGAVKGIMSLGTFSDRQFSSQDISLLTVMGNHIGTAIENARLFEEMERRYAELTAIYELTMDIAARQRIEELLPFIVQQAVELLSAESGGLYLWDAEREELEFVVGYNYSTDYIGIRLALGEGLCGEVAQSGKPLIVDDYRSWEGRSPQWEAEPITAVLGVPLKHGDDLVGTLFVGDRRNRTFKGDDIWLATLFANQAAVAIEHARLDDAVRKRTEELTLLNRVTSATTSTLDLQEVLQVMASEIATAFGVEQCAIALLDESRHQATVVAEYLAPGRPSALGDIIPLQDNPATEQVIATRTPLAIPDAQKDPLLAPVHHLMKKRETKSLLIVPLVVKGEVIGTIGVDVVQSQHEFTPEEIALAQAVASQAAIAIENARLYDVAKKRVAELTALQKIGLQLTQSLHPPEVLKAIAENALRLFQANDVHIFLYDEENDQLTFAASAWALDEDRKPAFGQPRENGVTATVARTGQPLLISEARSHPLFETYQDWRQSVESIAGYPLKRGDKVIGVFNIAFTYAHTFDEDELRLVTLLADQAAIAIQNAHLFQEVVESKQFLESLIDSSPDAIITTDENGVITSYSGVAQQIHGYEARECLGQPISKYYRQGKEDARTVMDILRREGKVQGYETEFVRKDGSIAPISLSASLLRDEKGQIIGTLGLGRDITQQKILQSQLLQAEKLSAIGQMIAGVAHELNNPLTTVIGYAELLQASDVDSQAKEDLERIYKDARRAQRIVENLLAFARQKEPQRSLLDINKILERTLELRRHQLTVDNVQVIKELARDLPWTLADGYQLQQVFLNIINNAHQALVEAHGGGTLTVRTELHSPRDGTKDVIKITFADDGPGIPMKIMDRIFDPFFTTKDVGLGTGLGLSISFGIIQEHGGRIWAESEMGQGATFLVELPVKRWIPEMIETPLEKHREATTSRRILVVNDEETVTKLIVRALTQQGHEVDAVMNPEAALEKLANNDYDLIVTDIKMPRSNGEQLYEQIAELDPRLAQRIIFMTGDVISASTRQFLQETKNRHVTKPLQLEELQRLVEESVATIEEVHDLATPFPGH